MSVWNTRATTRVGALREEYAAQGRDTGRMSDLDVLNSGYEELLLDQINTRDRYEALLTGLRRRDETVHLAANNAAQGQADLYTRYAVAHHMRMYHALLYRIAGLPDRPGPEQMQGLHQAAESIRVQLALEPRPEEILDPGGARQTLRTLQHVVGVLDGRDGLDGDEVVGLVKDILDGGASPTDVFTVADRGTAKPVAPPPPPLFAGPGWSDLRAFWNYQPDDAGAHVKAYPIGDDWYVDLWSHNGQLLAFGAAPETDLGVLAPTLVARAEHWSRDHSEYAWRRFADTAQSVRAQVTAASGEAAGPDEARVRAASATSPARPLNPAPNRAPMPPAGSQPPNSAPRHRR